MCFDAFIYGTNLTISMTPINLLVLAKSAQSSELFECLSFSFLGTHWKVCTNHFVILSAVHLHNESVPVHDSICEDIKYIIVSSDHLMCVCIISVFTGCKSKHYLLWTTVQNKV